MPALREAGVKYPYGRVRTHEKSSACSRKIEDATFGVSTSIAAPTNNFSADAVAASGLSAFDLFVLHASKLLH